MLGNAAGRKILCDIKRFIEEGTIDTPEFAVARLALDSLFNYILQSAGITDDSAVIDALAEVAKKFKIEPEKSKEKTMYEP